MNNTYDVTRDNLMQMDTASDNARMFIEMMDEGAYGDASETAASEARLAASYAFLLEPRLREEKR